MTELGGGWQIMFVCEKDGVTLEQIDGSCCEWALFFIFGVIFLSACPIGWEEHVDWIARRPFESPDEYLGDTGSLFRKRFNIAEPSSEFKSRWSLFAQKHQLATSEEITRSVEDLFVAFSTDPRNYAEFSECLADFFKSRGGIAFAGTGDGCPFRQGADGGDQE